MFKGKISIIGSGFVGATTAYTIMLSGLASELVLVDLDEKKAEGEAMDMSHGLSFVSPITITSGDYSLTKDSHLVIVTAGANQKQGETRIDLLKKNTNVFKGIFDNLTKYCNEDTIFLILTNPVDILTYITLKITGFTKNKVISSGTVLDTARLKYLIGEHTNVDVRNVHTYVVGEHGDSEVAAWSLTTIAGINLDEYCNICQKCNNNMKICRDEFYNKTKTAAYEIIERKGATYYAIALAVRRIIESISGNENSILTVSSLLEGEYGIKDICLSVPSIVNKNGVDKILEVPLSDSEIKDLQKSALILKDLAKQVGF